jgi:DNA-binding transcriptional MerR regulator
MSLGERSWYRPIWHRSHEKEVDRQTCPTYRSGYNPCNASMRDEHRAVNSEELQFGSDEVCQLARVSLRQLQWWDERKIVSPRQEGHRRVYDASDVIGMMLVAELRRKGMSLQKIRPVVRSVRREMGRQLDQIVSGKSELYLLTDGTIKLFADQSARVIELLKKSRKPLVLVSICEMAKRLSEFQETARSGNPQHRVKSQLKLF